MTCHFLIDSKIANQSILVLFEYGKHGVGTMPMSCVYRRAEYLRGNLGGQRELSIGIARRRGGRDLQISRMIRHKKRKFVRCIRDEDACGLTKKKEQRKKGLE